MIPLMLAHVLDFSIFPTMFPQPFDYKSNAESISRSIISSALLPIETMSGGPLIGEKESAKRCQRTIPDPSFTGRQKTAETKHIGDLARRCLTGYSEKMKKYDLYNEEKALKDWKEFLDLRYKQKSKGGKAFVMTIVQIVKDKKTIGTPHDPTEVDLSKRVDTLKFLTEWCKAKVAENGWDLNLPESKDFHEISQRTDTRREDVQAWQELALPTVPSAQPDRPRGDERIPKRARTALEIMTQAGERARKTFEERMAKAEEEARKTMDNAEEEAWNTLE